MLEIWLQPSIDNTPLLETEIPSILKLCVALDWPCNIHRAPTVPTDRQSAWVQASHEAAGIWHLPLKPGHVHVLITRDEGIGPQIGQCMGRRITFGGISGGEMALTATLLHELGHVTNAVGGRPTVMKLASKPEYSRSAVKAKHELIKQMTAHHPEGIVEFQGKHCLAPGCIMNPWGNEIADIVNPWSNFCQECAPRFKRGRDKLMDLADRAKDTCGQCKQLEQCMYKNGKVWEGSPLCKDFEAKTGTLGTIPETPPA